MLINRELATFSSVNDIGTFLTNNTWGRLRELK